MNNIGKMGNSIVIFNGGNPLPGCPASWDEAYELEDKLLNNGKTREDREGEHGVFWEFDCGFKLDYDGGLVNIFSRFYPPKTHYGDKWDGSCSVILLDKEVSCEKFECDTLEQLKQEVEAYVKSIENKIRKVIKTV